MPGYSFISRQGFRRLYTEEFSTCGHKDVRIYFNSELHG